jgi:hypothetical protein
MVILLQMGSVELGGYEVTFHGHCQESNVNQYQVTNSPIQGDLGHYQYLSMHVYPLSRDQRAAYIAAMIQQILEFLEM